MNYQKIYDDICKRGQERILPKEVYTEKHHIIPKCLGGGNETTNLTRLTAREHFLVHLILARKLHPKNPKLWTAMHYMINRKSSKGNRYVGNSREYEELRREINANLKGQTRSQEFKDNQSKKRTGIPRNPDLFRFFMENHPRANKIKHHETGLIFNSKTQCATYFSLTKDVLNTRIKHGEFEILVEENTKLTEKSFIMWLRTYLEYSNDVIDISLIRTMISNIKGKNKK